MPAPFDLAQALSRAVAAYTAGDLAQVAACCKLILSKRRNHFDALHLLGIVELQQGRPQEALPLFKRALKANPRSAAAHLNIGLVLGALNGPAAALPHLNAAVAINPNDALAHNNHGNTLWQLNRHDEALASLTKAVALAPNYGDAYCNRGNVLCSLRRFEEALADLNRAVQINPRDLLAWHSRGHALCELNRPEEALQSYERSVSIAPGDVAALMDHGRLLQKLGRFSDAQGAFAKVLAIAPDHVPAMKERGISLARLKRLDEAVASFDKLLAIKPDDAEALMSRGNALGELGQFDEAIASLDRSLTLRPGNAEAHWNRSHVRLRTGDFEGGWRDYEWRLAMKPGPAKQRDFAQPRWHRDESLQAKTILVHAEQGLGDTIQFARYATLLARRGANVLLEVQKPLQSLLSRIEGVACVIGTDDELPAFDCHCPLLSLPLELGIELETLPKLAPYLVASSDRITKWKERLPRTDAMRVAIAWAGNSTFVDDVHRSIGLQHLLPLLSVPGVEFYSIQKILRDGDNDVLKQHPFIVHLGDELDDFEDTAGIMAHMDLVVSSDTSVVHLAGALGVPVWILLQYASDWRWLTKRDDCPWYPTARLFRQPRQGDWSSVIAGAAGALDRFRHDRVCSMGR